MNNYYVYMYLREDGTPYYVGKGKGNRAYEKHGPTFQVPPRERINIVLQNLTEKQAFSNEIDFIAWYGRLDINTGILENRTHGGEGSSGFRHTDEWKIRLKTESIFVTNNPGKNKSKETKEKIRQRTKEAMAQPDVREKYLESLKTRDCKQTPESIAKMLETKRINGTLNLSEETKRKISEAHKGKVLSEETRNKMSVAFKGRVPWNKGKSGYTHKKKCNKVVVTDL